MYRRKEGRFVLKLKETKSTEKNLTIYKEKGKLDTKRKKSQKCGRRKMKEKNRKP